MAGTLEVGHWGGATVHPPTFTPGAFAESYFPPVARWEWDSAHQIQYIGIKCGDSWCSIGPAGFTRADWVKGTGSLAARARSEVRGWHDEQALAPAGGSATAPTSIRGTVVPTEDLGQLDTPGEFASWHLVARVFLSDNSPDYRRKYGFAKAAVGDSGNRLYLCSGKQGDCPGPRPASLAGTPSCIAADSAQAASSSHSVERWYAKIEPADGGPPEFHCVTRRDHTPLFQSLQKELPGTARWRWVATDETIWVRCMFGCCQVH